MTANPVVITGGAGYVGSVIAKHLLYAGYPVVVLDRLAGGGEGVLALSGHPLFRMDAADVRDEAALDRVLAGARAVVHLAAVVGEPACSVNPDESRAINREGTRALLAAVERQGVARALVVTTCSNYGVSDPRSMADEDTPLHPLGVYAQSKVEAERLALAHTGTATVSVLRFGTICGLSPRMRFDLLVNEMARAAALDEPIRVFAPDAWRPFLHIGDAARAVEWWLGSPPLPGRVYNVVGENYQKKGLVALVRRHFPSVRIDVEATVPDQRDYRVSGDRVRVQGGFAPAFTVEDAVMEISAAVRAGWFRDPHWAGYAAAPVAAPAAVSAERG